MIENRLFHLKKNVKMGDQTAKKNHRFARGAMRSLTVSGSKKTQPKKVSSSKTSWDPQLRYYACYIYILIGIYVYVYIYIFICMYIHGYAMYRHRTREPLYIYTHIHIYYMHIF